MAVFTKIRIGGRLRLAFGALFVALTLVGGAGLYQSAQISEIAHDMAGNRVPSLEIMGRMVAYAERLRQLQAGVLLAGTPERKAVLVQQRSEALNVFQVGLQEYLPLIEPGEETQIIIPAIEAAWKDYQAQSLLLDSAKDQSAADEVFSIQLQPAVHEAPNRIGG